MLGGIHPQILAVALSGIRAVDTKPPETSGNALGFVSTGRGKAAVGIATGRNPAVCGSNQPADALAGARRRGVALRTYRRLDEKPQETSGNDEVSYPRERGNAAVGIAGQIAMPSRQEPNLPPARHLAAAVAHLVHRLPRRIELFDLVAIVVQRHLPGCEVDLQLRCGQHSPHQVHRVPSLVGPLPTRQIPDREPPDQRPYGLKQWKPMRFFTRGPTCFRITTTAEILAALRFLTEHLR